MILLDRNIHSIYQYKKKFYFQGEKLGKVPGLIEEKLILYCCSLVS